MCYDGVSGPKSRELHLLGAVRLGSEPEALLIFEGGLEAAAANDSQEDQEPVKGVPNQADDPGCRGGGQG